jgi:hypothetical protein
MGEMKYVEPTFPLLEPGTFPFLQQMDIRRSDILKVLAALLLLGAAMVAADSHFTFLDDEAVILMAADKPVTETIKVFLTEKGEHEHPPLADILLHFWLPVGRTNPHWLRLPSVLFYLTGLLALTAAAWRLAGRSAGWALLGIFLLWPFGFQFGRLAGWYSLAFLLVNLLTLGYLRLLRQPAMREWFLFGVPAVLLVYTNYFGWAVIGCLALDYMLRHRRRDRLSLKALTVFLLGVFLLFTPLLRAFLEEFQSSSDIMWPLSSKVYFGAYNFYCLFVSESVAPWCWPLSVPVSLAILLAIGLSFGLIAKEVRYFLAYFVLLYLMMTFLGIDTTKRLLFTSPWLLLGIACALASHHHKRSRRLLATCLGVIAAVGWFGILTRRYYASPHFLEPWPQVADLASHAIQQGNVVVANHPVFFFYLDYSLARADHSDPSASRDGPPRWPQNPRLYKVDDWGGSGHPTRSTILFVRGRSNAYLNDTIAAQSWLDNHCSLQEETRLIPDVGYLLRSRYLPGGNIDAYRIYISRYRCPSEEPEIIK